MAVDLVVRCLRGTEWIVASEVDGALRPERIDLAPRQVSVTVPDLTPGVLDLRTVDDAFLVVGTTPDPGHTKDVPPRLAAEIGAADWGSALDRLRAVRAVPCRPVFDVVANFVGRRNFNRYTLEDRIGAELTRVLGGTYVSHNPVQRSGGTPRGTDLTVRIMFGEGIATITLRVAGRPLHRRAYKRHTGPGTLHPPLAAALARLAGPSAGETVLDPFCGDGTCAIEAYAQCPDAAILAADVSAERVANARANARAFGAEVEVTEQDAGRLPFPDGEIDVIVTNPPWNLAVDAGGTLTRSLLPFWRRLSRLLSDTGRVCVVVDRAQDAPAVLRDLDYPLTVSVPIRLAGRLCDIVLAAPPGREPASLSPELRAWLDRARAAGVVHEQGF